MRAKSLMSEAATAWQLERSWPGVSPYKEELGKEDDWSEVPKSKGRHGEDTGVLQRGEAGGR